MRGDAGKGTEGWSTSSFEMPRLKLIQGISPEIQNYDGVKAGDFFHTTLEQSLGSKLTITVLNATRRYVLWAPRPPIDKGGILARADDEIHWNPPNAEFKVKVDKRGTEVVWRTRPTVAESRLAEWGTYDPSDYKSPPAATECHVLVIAIEEYPEVGPVAMMLQRSSLSVVRKLLSKIKFMSIKVPVYGIRFIMSSVVDGPQDQQFHNYRFMTDGFITDPDQYDEYKSMAEVFKATPVVLRDMEGAQDETSDTSGGGRVNVTEEMAQKESRF
jgi:hypothetical protein